MNVEKIRRDFPFLKRGDWQRPPVYFDNASTTQKPGAVIGAILEFYKSHYGNVGRGVHSFSREASEAYDKARKNTAKFIGAKPEEIIFTKNATEALNMAVQSFADKLTEKDSIVTTVLEHHSNYVPLRLLAKRTGAKVSLIDEGEGELDRVAYSNAIRNSRLASVTHISNVLGTVNPVKEMIEEAHDAGARFILDGAQSVPHMPVDVKKLDCDFLSFSGHKMLGPTGVGVLYAKSEILEEMDPAFAGGGTVSNTCPGDVVFLSAPEKFEAGTPNIAGAVGLSSAIDYLRGIGMKKIEKHEKDLAKAALAGMGDLEVYGSRKASGIISFNLRGLDASDLANLLDEKGVMIRSGQHCAQPLMCRLGVEETARASFYIYNNTEEVDYFLGLLNKVGELA